MGGMMAFISTPRVPKLFAASLFVGCQWNIRMLDPLAKKNFFYIASVKAIPRPPEA